MFRTFYQTWSSYYEYWILRSARGWRPRRCLFHDHVPIVLRSHSGGELPGPGFVVLGTLEVLEIPYAMMASILRRHSLADLGAFRNIVYAAVESSGWISKKEAVRRERIVLLCFASRHGRQCGIIRDTQKKLAVVGYCLWSILHVFSTSHNASVSYRRSSQNMDRLQPLNIARIKKKAHWPSFVARNARKL